MRAQISPTTPEPFTFLLRVLLALAVLATPAPSNPCTTQLSAQGGLIAALERAAALSARRATLFTREAAVAAQRAATASAPERATLVAAAEHAQTAAVLERAVAASDAERLVAERAEASQSALTPRWPDGVSGVARNFGRKLRDWNERYGLDESALSGAICDALQDALVDQEPPTWRSVAASVAGSRMFRGLDDADARVIANELLDIVFQEEGGPYDNVHVTVSRWKERNC